MKGGPGHGLGQGVDLASIGDGSGHGSAMALVCQACLGDFSHEGGPSSMGGPIGDGHQGGLSGQDGHCGHSAQGGHGNITRHLTETSYVERLRRHTKALLKGLQEGAAGTSRAYCPSGKAKD